MVPDVPARVERVKGNEGVLLVTDVVRDDVKPVPSGPLINPDEIPFCVTGQREVVDVGFDGTPKEQEEEKLFGM